MTTVTIPGIGLLYPPSPSPQNVARTIQNSTAINAATDKTAMIGYLNVVGRPTSAKTLSAAGGGSIGFRTGAVTWANAGTNVDIGIQGVSATAGPPARPDGAFTVSKSCVPGTTAISANAWNTIAMGTGSASLTHGDLVAVVFDMTTLGGADSVVISCGTQVSSTPLPTVNEFQASAWLTNNSSRNPIIVITFDDGTLATLAFSLPFTSVTTDGWNTGSAADEHGVVFQVPFDCTVCGFWWEQSIGSSAADGELKLYSTPFGTPSLVKSVSLDANNTGATPVNTQRWAYVIFTTPVSLTANTDYVLAWLATTATTRTMTQVNVDAAAHLNLWPGQSTCHKVTRDASTGAFSETTTAVYDMGVVIDSITGFGGGGGIKLAGRGGLAG